ncbi:MAG: ABC transporter ATP-binding protein [Halobacteriales archaeon]
MSDDPLLSVRGLTKHFRITEGVMQREVGRVRAVDGIDFEIRRGETFGLIGETGCGKSTAARTLLRLEDPTDGTVVFDGEPVTEFGPTALKRFRRRAQMIFQDPTSSFDPRMRIGESIAEPLRAHGLSDKAERDELVETMLGHVGLATETAQQYPHELSGGQKQRAALARALVVNPELLVADEPVSALDVSVQAEILDLLDDLQDAFDLSILFITHDINVVREICDRVAVMYLGEIVEMGPTGTLLENPQHPYTRALVASIPTLDPDDAGRQATLSGEVPDPSNPPSGCRFHTRCPEVIPPEEYEIEQAHWRAIVRLRVQLAEPDATPADFAADIDPAADEPTPEAAAVREHFDIPAALDDAAAEAELAAAIDAIVDGKLEAAAGRLQEQFPTPCIEDWPEMRQTAVDHPAACHLHPAD